MDNVINPGPFVGDKLFVKVYSLASWNERVNWRTPRPPEEGWNENRQLPDTRSVRRLPQVPIARHDGHRYGRGRCEPQGHRQSRWELRHGYPYPEQGLGASPQFRVHFYAGDPQKNGRLLSRHNSGPIMPGGTWGERGPKLTLMPHEDTIVVVIDPDDKVKELDETNNKATHVIPGRKAAPSPAGTAIDMAVTDESLTVTANPDGGFVAHITICNKGTNADPAVRRPLLRRRSSEKRQAPEPAQFWPDHAGRSLA